MVKTGGSYESPIKLQLELELWIHLSHVLLENWTELGELMQEDGIHNSLIMSKEGWKHSNPKALSG